MDRKFRKESTSLLWYRVDLVTKSLCNDELVRGVVGAGAVIGMGALSLWSALLFVHYPFMCIGLIALVVLCCIARRTWSNVRDDWYAPTLSDRLTPKK